MIKGYIEKVRSGGCSSAEIALIGIALLLLGIVIGMKLAPARIAAFGSFNGNSGSVVTPKELKNMLRKSKKKKKKDKECCGECCSES